MKRFAGAWMALMLAGCTVSYTPQSQGDLPEPTRGTDAQRDEAIAAARFYTGVIDRGDYELVWRLGSPALRASTNHFMFTNAIKLGRKVLGAPGNRSPNAVVFTTQPDPGTPVGEYAVVDFRTPGENSITTERVVLQKERRRWKIAGYFVIKKGQWKRTS